MRTRATILLCGLLVLPAVAANTVSASDDEWEEEIVTTVVRKKRKKDAPAQTLQTVQPEAPATNGVPPPPPPPPEPPDADAAEPRRLVRYFCKCWKDEDYNRLWWAMTPQYRKNTPFRKFAKFFAEDKESNGGLVDENIVLSDVELDDGGVQVTVDLRYRFKRVPVKRVKAVVEKKGTVYRVRESGLIPIDLDDL